MKNMKTPFLMIMIVLLSCWACNKNDTTFYPEENPAGTKIALSFIPTTTFTTRAFGTNQATAAEKAVLSGKLFIFRTGNKVFEKYLTSTELATFGSQPLVFTVPGLIASTSYDYYLIINNGNVSATNLAALQALTQNDIASYNGPWSNVNDANTTPYRSGGFVMTGNTSATTSADLTQTQNVNITAKRITAKVDINTIIDNTVFGSGNKYAGTISIDSAIISKTQSTSSLLLGTPPTTVGTLTLAKQIPNVVTANSNYQNRFYLFENGALNAGSRVMLTLYGTYTYNGVSNIVTYPVELTGNTTGAIVRNGAYSVTANIEGLSGTSVSVTVTLSDWETIVNQSANLGN